MLLWYNFVILSRFSLNSSLIFCSLQENPYPSVAMHKVTRPSENGQNNTQNQKLFPGLDEVTVQLFIDHAAAKVKTAPPVVKAELKGMVPSGPPLGELAEASRTEILLIFNLHFFFWSF